jgi:glutamate-1-semialdehyde 2,1-aminomutase
MAEVADTDQTNEAQTNEALFKRAGEVIPGGVNSPVRAFRSVGGTPYFVARAEGAYVIDVEGNRYIDYVQSYGASILGHAHPVLVEAITKAARDGSSYGAPTEREVLLAEAIRDRVPGCDMVRLVSSGTEAGMSAIRLARGHTGRSRIVKFAGCYHGHSDNLLAAGGSGVATLGLSGSAGVPDSAVAQTLVVPYNEVLEIDDDVAAIIVEPVAANMGLVPPEPGFLQGLRDVCDRTGALLIFDEVITGFRLGLGGATEKFGVRPDLWMFGKVIGGGLPVGAFAGRRDVMESLAPIGPVYQAGTLSGNPLATAAGLAVLGELDEAAYRRIEATATRLVTGIQDAAAKASVPITVARVGPLCGVFFGEGQPRNYEEAKTAADNGVYPKFFHGLLDRGVAVAPGAYEVLFPSLAHTDEDIDRTIEAVSEALAAI